ncbi:MAG: hypothetical protein LBV32_07485 [Tannerellaceae bacterium]|jgi:hypothetical protein|nr:hypothetical protein [Tannerellaceae bacterium]
MKIRMLILLFTFAATVLNGCDELFNTIPSHFELSLSFQDSSGKDLLKGIEYTKSQTKDSLTGQIATDMFTFKYFNSRKLTPRLHWELIYSEYVFPDYGSICFPPEGGQNNRMDFTYQLSCPYIFGDNVMHEIVAYCKETKHREYECFRLTFDGKEIAVEKGDEYGQTKAIVVLN